MADDFMNGFVAGQNDGGCRNGGGMWGEGSWMWIIVVFALLFGWGNNGLGGNRGGGSGSGVADGYVLATDFANIERKIDGVNSGICDGFYAVNTGMLNGFAGVTQAVTSGFSAAELSRCNQQAALMQQLNNMAMQAADCCCKTQTAIQGVNYNLATQACDTRNLIQTATRDIIDAQNAGNRMLYDYLVTDKITGLQAENQSLKLAASQCAQNAYFANTLDAQAERIMQRVAPTATPSYIVPNPFATYGCGGYNNCGYNSCSGCAA